MVYFKDYHDDGRTYLCIVGDPKDRASFVRRSMLRPETQLHLCEMRTGFPKEMTVCLDAEEHAGSSYVLKSTLKENETKSRDIQFPMLGCKILCDSAKWASIIFKIFGEFSYLPLYWEWTEDIIARYATNLQSSEIYDAVYASLYTYDRDPHILRAFCESWCPQTNTLHTRAGEWSIFLWDLYKLGGLPVSGHIYDEAIPSFSVMDAREKDGTKSISRACQHLFYAYCLLTDLPDFKNGVRATQWIQFWCKQKTVYKKPPQKRPRGIDSRPKNTHNPSGEISAKSFDWTFEELSVFSELGIFDEAEKKITYLAAFLSCWLCVFVLPEHDDRIIRPATFEVATQMASGAIFSLAVPVLAGIYHGLNRMVDAPKPAFSNSFFPAHYLYGWLAHYFGTHHGFDSRPIGPLMVQYSGFQGAKYYTDIVAHELIHEGFSFRACRLMLSKNRRELVFDNNQLDTFRISYIISLRTAYLPLRFQDYFVLLPYSLTRFSRQFGFCQAIPGMLPEISVSTISFSIILKYARMLLFEGSHSQAVLPGYTLNWKDLTTDKFKNWSKVTVNDLREHVQILLSSVISKKANRVTTPGGDVDDSHTGENMIVPRPQAGKMHAVNMGKRVVGDHSSDDESETDFKHRRRGKKKKTHVATNFPLEEVPDFSDVPTQPDSNEKFKDFDLDKEVPNLIDEPLLEGIHPRVIHGMGKPTPPGIHQIPQAADLSSSIEGSHSVASPGIVPKASPTSSLFTFQPTRMANSITGEAVAMMKKRLLQRLKKAPYDQVENVKAGAANVYESIQKLGGDPSDLRAMVDAYARDVEAFLMVKKDTVGKGPSDQLAHNISEVETCLQSAKTILDDALQAGDDQEKQLSLVAEERVALEALLQAQRDKEANLKEQHHQQLETISAAKSKVASLQQELESLISVQHTSQEEIEDLEKMQAMLEKSRENLDVAIP